MRVFKNTWFERFARQQNISDKALIDAVQRAEKGLVDASLGNGVIKQRIARTGQGKSSGYRTIILYRTAERAFFIYGFEKSERANIDNKEEAMFKKLATYVLGLSDKQLAELITRGQFSEVNGNDEKISK